MAPAHMIEILTRLSEQSGCPSSSGLTIFPLAEPGSEVVFDVSSAKTHGGGLRNLSSDVSALSSTGWHSDGSFEPAAADYTMFRMKTVPPTGGDTIWCSTYDLYDRLSPPLARMLEGLKARHDASAFYPDKARKMGQHIHLDNRGSPLNSDLDMKAEHPVIRTNPVTGWKSLFVNMMTTKRLLGLTYDESHALLAYLFDLVPHSHDVHVRFKWRPGDIAVWDNRCTVHTATHDYTDFRQATHVRSLGEAPYLDPVSTGKKEALLAQSAK